MMRFLSLWILIFSAGVAVAEIVVPTRTLRPNTVVSAADIQLIGGERLGVFDRLQDVIGQETQVALYAGRPIPFESIGPPALVDRNQIVLLRFTGASLVISTEGRALERGGIGDRVRIMNLNSRTTLFGYVQADGSVRVVN